MPTAELLDEKSTNVYVYRFYSGRYEMSIGRFWCENLVHEVINYHSETFLLAQAVRGEVVTSFGC